jgi:hypothetical protein
MILKVDVKKLPKLRPIPGFRQTSKVFKTFEVYPSLKIGTHPSTSSFLFTFLAGVIFVMMVVIIAVAFIVIAATAAPVTTAATAIMVIATATAATGARLKARRKLDFNGDNDGDDINNGSTGHSRGGGD